MHWTEKRRAKVNLGRALKEAGWRLYGWKEDESDSMTDYYNPESWEGVAEKDSHFLVVEVSNGKYGSERLNDKFGLKIKGNPYRKSWHLEKDGVQRILIGAVEQVDLLRFLAQRHSERRVAGVADEGLLATLDLDGRELGIVLYQPHLAPAKVLLVLVVETEPGLDEPTVVLRHVDDVRQDLGHARHDQC